MPNDEWRPAVLFTSADELTRLGRELIYEAERDHRPMPEPPHWRFYLHPSVYDLVFRMVALGNYTPYVYAGVEISPPESVIDRHGYVLRIYGLLVLSDPVMNPAVLELRYVLRKPLLTSEPKEMDHDGYPSHP